VSSYVNVAIAAKIKTACILLIGLTALRQKHTVE